MDVKVRARLHRALGDEVRLKIVDELLLADRTPAELGETVDLPSNLLAHHLGVLEETGLVIRHLSEGDRRKRYLSLERYLIEGLVPGKTLGARSVLFVCTHNSARSQFAEAALKVAALKVQTDLVVQSAGTLPTASVHPKAVAAAAELGISLEGGRTKAYDEVVGEPDLVISVCDRAHEAPMPFEARSLHWSIPDPIGVNRVGAFRSSFIEIGDRVDRLVDAIEGGDRS
jgi:protein-tyrosine-phosphatase